MRLLLYPFVISALLLFSCRNEKNLSIYKISFVAENNKETDTTFNKVYALKGFSLIEKQDHYYIPLYHLSDTLTVVFDNFSKPDTLELLYSRNSQSGKITYSDITIGNKTSFTSALIRENKSTAEKEIVLSF